MKNKKEKRKKEKSEKRMKRRKKTEFFFLFFFVSEKGKGEREENFYILPLLLSFFLFVTSPNRRIDSNADCYSNSRTYRRDD